MGTYSSLFFHHFFQTLAQNTFELIRMQSGAPQQSNFQSQCGVTSWLKKLLLEMKHDPHNFTMLDYCFVSVQLIAKWILDIFTMVLPAKKEGDVYIQA